MLEMGGITFGGVHSVGFKGRRQFEVFVDGERIGLMVEDMEGTEADGRCWVGDSAVEALLGGRIVRLKGYHVNAVKRLLREAYDNVVAPPVESL